MADILRFLKGADAPAQDQKMFLKAHILFWLIGATDGHAKNFSVFLGGRGSFHLTPFYDVLTAQPGMDRRQIERKHMKLAMSVGNQRHYKIEEIAGRHFWQTAETAGLPGSLADDALQEVARDADRAMKLMEQHLSPGFPEEIHVSVTKALTARLRKI
jgi:serine/threonine-protein kinase HipA